MVVRSPHPIVKTQNLMTFQSLNLNASLLGMVERADYTAPTPIQSRTIPHILDGRDIVGCAQTGTGKTAAFVLPIIQMLESNPDKRSIRVLVLAPTRELAAQIDEEFDKFSQRSRLRHAVIFGGVGQQPQVDAIRRGVDILVATPGRLLDLMNQRIVRLKRIEFLVLDEADRMLDMGFIHDVKRIISTLPDKRQTLLFSATMPQAIQDLSRSILIKPVKVEVDPQSTTVDKVAQSVFFVERTDKRKLLKQVLADSTAERVLIFTRTKHRANNLSKQLSRARFPAEAIHGDKSQGARMRALANFKSGRAAILVATDIAARGLDIDAVTHVINFDLPDIPESYVHRIGRTARAGARGIAYSFCDVDERGLLKDIEKLIRQRIPVVSDHAYVSEFKAPPPSLPRRSEPRRSRRRRR